MPHLELYAADGSQVLGPDTTLLRFFGEHEIPANWSGTFPMPGFDSPGGFFVPSFRASLFDVYSRNLLPDTHAYDQNTRSIFVPMELPDLYWSDTNDEMHVTDNVLPANYVNFPYSTAVMLRFFYYRGGRSVTDQGLRAEFRTASGELQLSFESALYAVEADQTKRHRDHTEFMSEASLAPRFRTLNAGTDRYLQTATTAFADISTNGSNVIAPDMGDTSDLVFYQLTSPIVYSSSAYMAPNAGLSKSGAVSFVATDDNAPVAYKRLSVTPPAGPLPSVPHLSLFSDAGDTLFDSRHPNMRIVKAELISEAQMKGVIEDGDVIDIALPYAVNDPWVCCPYWASFREVGNSFSDTSVHRPAIRKLSNTVLRIERNQSSNSTLRRNYYQAAWVIIGQP